MSGQFTLIGSSSLISTRRLNRLCDFCRPNGIRKTISIEVSDVVFDDDLETGERTLSDGEWDGTCYPELGIVQVMLSPRATFPMTCWINPELEGNYIRGMYLETPEEFFVYFLSHEMRHIWQEGKTKSQMLGYSLDGDEESDSDLFAILKLSQWRRETS